MQWVLTGLLIGSSAGILAFTGYLLRRLFTIEPATSDPATSGTAAETAR